MMRKNALRMLIADRMKYATGENADNKEVLIPYGWLYL